MNENERVVVVGAGYVGLPTAAALAAGRIGGSRRSVVLLERNQARLDAIMSDYEAGKDPLGEPGMRDLLSEAFRDPGGLTGLTLTCLPALIGRSTRGFVAIVCVGTPTDEATAGHRLDHSMLIVAIREVVELGARLVIVRSTTSPAALSDLRAAALGDGAGAFLVLAPEFLREGHAVEDVLRPSRIVVGADDRAIGELVVKGLQPTPLDGRRVDGMGPSSWWTPWLVVDLVSASIAKLAANAYLAERAAWATRTAWIAEEQGGDAGAVLAACGLDPRISTVGAGPGLGVGGPCLPKDAREFAMLWRDAADWVPDGPSEVGILALEKVSREILRLGLSGPVVVVGLGFKPDASDSRGSPALRLAGRIAAERGECWAVSDEIPEVYPDPGLRVVSGLDDYPEWAAAILCRRPRVEDRELLLAARVVFDPYALLSVLDVARLFARGIDYRGAGRGEAWLRVARSAVPKAE